MRADGRHLTGRFRQLAPARRPVPIQLWDIRRAAATAALVAAAFPRLGPAGRAATLGAVPAVGLTRIYVGAHLPLDIAGGAALGLMIDAALTIVSNPPRSARAEGEGPAVPWDELTRIFGTFTRGRTSRRKLRT